MKEETTGPGLIGVRMSEGRVIDEICRCSHSMRYHVRGGHGACTKCKCERYTWKSFVFAKEEVPR